MCRRHAPPSLILREPNPNGCAAASIYLAAHLRGCRSIALAFNRRYGSQVTVGKTWVWEVVREHAAEIRELRREIKRAQPTRIAVARQWALDLTYFVGAGGVTFTVLGILDAGSRRLMRLKVLPRKCAFTILGHLLLAFAEHGPPRIIRTDNEAMFTSALWRITLQALAISHRRAPPAQPWRNGRIERFFGTLKAEFGRKWSGATAMLAASLIRFANFYNVDRPHQALGGLTPQEAWQGIGLAEVQLRFADQAGQAALDARHPTFHVRE